jgi:hypothetical protein
MTTDANCRCVDCGRWVGQLPRYAGLTEAGTFVRLCDDCALVRLEAERPPVKEES